jgi:YfiH family protein
VLERRISDTGVVFYVSTLLEGAGVPHAFSTRVGGISSEPFDSLNLGNPQGAPRQDDLQRIEENYHRLQLAIGLNGKERCWVHQVHAGDVVTVRRGHGFTSGAKADALVSDDPTRPISVRIADCVPILLASSDGAVVGAVHAGWRGVIARALPNAIGVMNRMTTAPLIAAIGPCIGFENFEVGPEVLDEFVKAFGEAAPIRHTPDGKGRVDLRAALIKQLGDANVSPDRIDSADLCTVRDAAEFFSHRRDQGITGRMAAIIAARPAPRSVT